MATDQATNLTHLSKSAHDLAERTAMLAGTRWGDGLAHGQVETLARHMDSFQIDEGKTILHEGGTAGYMVLVVEGKVDVVKNDCHDTPKVVATVGPGRTFGEMSLFDGEPRSASAVAGTHVTFLLLSREAFEIVSKSFPALGIAIYSKLAKLLSQRLRQTTGRLVDYL